MAAKPVALKSVSAGFRSDVATLFNAFLATESVRFEKFAEVWRLLKFSCIFKGRQNRNEMYEFIEDMFSITLAQLKSSGAIDRQIACLYLLYGLYNKQQIEPKVKIRVTLETLQCLRQLYDRCKSEKHIDAAFIWLKMLSQGAFAFVSDEQVYGPSFIRSAKVVGSDNSEASDLSNQLCFALLPQIDELSKVHFQYQQMKGVQTHESVNSLNLLENDIFDEFNDSLKKLQQQFKCDNGIGFANTVLDRQLCLDHNS
ncbi:snRNA-activating protein complex subunit 1-like protein [Leptotrombidium deliense]|uniref:snRNA-activating protein complex subunit 1-like protein n=1 Tax=Leptotrombidium deliense TaxID=299467 RepID=A0A443SWQ2_9ACAR|nr:snRNA-activating protein complex subunit 1-like protein [Leptotrombidium deliense]